MFVSSSHVRVDPEVLAHADAVHRVVPDGRVAVDVVEGQAGVGERALGRLDVHLGLRHVGQDRVVRGRDADDDGAPSGIGQRLPPVRAYR